MVKKVERSIIKRVKKKGVPISENPADGPYEKDRSPRYPRTGGQRIPRHQLENI